MGCGSAGAGAREEPVGLSSELASPFWVQERKGEVPRKALRGLRRRVRAYGACVARIDGVGLCCYAMSAAFRAWVAGIWNSERKEKY